MKILIVVATSKEIIDKKNHKIKILTTGIGMVNTTYFLTQELIKERYNLVINMGVAGSFKEDIKIGEVVEVISDCFSEIGSEDGKKFLNTTDIELDIEVTFIAEKKTELRKVNAITVNTVHGNQSSIEHIKRRLDPDIESMEGAAVMMVCKKFNIPCLQIRAISNLIEKRNKEKWNLPLAVKNLNKEVYNIINSL